MTGDEYFSDYVHTLSVFLFLALTFRTKYPLLWSFRNPALMEKGRYKKESDIDNQVTLK